MAGAAVMAPADPPRGGRLPARRRRTSSSSRRRARSSPESVERRADVPGRRRACRAPERCSCRRTSATTLRQIAEGGAEAFYRGPIARAIARALEAQGWLGDGGGPRRRPADVGHTARRRLPGPRGVRSACRPPTPSSPSRRSSSSRAFDLKGMGHNSVEYLHHFIEAAKIASADRVGLDVLKPGAPIAGLISPGYAADRRTLIDPKRAGVSGGERLDLGAPRRRDPARASGRLREGAHHAFRGRRCGRHRGHRHPDARQPLRFRRDGSGHRHAARTTS